MANLVLGDPFARFAYSIRSKSDEWLTNVAQFAASGLSVQLVKKPRHSFARLLEHFSYVVYIDSRDPNAVFQVDKWFRHGFLPPRKTVVFFKYYRSIGCSYVRFFRERGYSCLGIKRFAGVTLEGIDAVFYPFNTNSTPILLKKRDAKHIFIGHGESDKWASVNPMFRMYDHIFVAGDAAIERLKNHRIVNALDIDDGRCVKVGLPYIGQNKDFFAVKDAQVRRGLLYAPTWEGGAQGQLYSSLEDGYGEAMIGSALERTSEEVVFQPHPSTGQQDDNYLEYVRSILIRFGGHPRFRLALPESSTVFRRLRGTIGRSRVQRADANLCDLWSLKWMITDVSSMMAEAAFCGCPMVVIAKDRQTVGATAHFDPAEYPLMSLAHRILEFGSSAEQLMGAIGTIEEREYGEVLQRLRAATEAVVGLEPGVSREAENGEMFAQIMSRLI